MNANVLPKEIVYGIGVVIYLFVEVIVGWVLLKKSPTLGLLRGIGFFFAGLLYLIVHPKYLIGVLAVLAIAIWLLVLALGVRINPAPAPARPTQASIVVVQSTTEVVPTVAVNKTAPTAQASVLPGWYSVQVSDLAVFTVLPETNDPSKFDQGGHVVAHLTNGDKINVVGWTSHTFTGVTVGGVVTGDFIVASLDNGKRVYVFAGMIDGSYTTSLDGAYKALPQTN